MTASDHFVATLVSVCPVSTVVLTSGGQPTPSQGLLLAETGPTKPPKTIDCTMIPGMRKSTQYPGVEIAPPNT